MYMPTAALVSSCKNGTMIHRDGYDTFKNGTNFSFRFKILFSQFTISIDGLMYPTNFQDKTTVLFGCFFF